VDKLGSVPHRASVCVFVIKKNSKDVARLPLHFASTLVTSSFYVVYLGFYKYNTSDSEKYVGYCGIEK